MSYKKYTAEEKLNIITEYSKGNYTWEELANKYQISRYAINRWREKYNQYGLAGLKRSSSCKKYSKKLKELAVNDYLSGLYSKYEIIRKYEISNRGVLTNWITKYNSHIELKNTVNGEINNMTKRKSPNWKVKIEIVLFCIANNLEYQKTATEYGVSYQQVYCWVKKYKTGNEEALRDRRGRKKDHEELTPEEQIKLKLKKLEAENQRLKAENLLLKKLEELERRRY